MLARLIDENRSRMTRNIVEPASFKRKALITEILDGRCEIDLSVKPGYDVMLIGRCDIEQMARLQGADMSIDNCIIEVALVRHCQQQHKGGSGSGAHEGGKPQPPP